MFWPDVLELKRFYSTPLGQVSCRIVRRKLREIWPDVRGEKIVGIGYPSPYLVPFIEESAMVASFMPALQGAMQWPIMREGRTILTSEDELPLPDNSVEKVMVVHALENSDRVQAMVEECWRILIPGGRLLVIVPNCSGLWSRIENNPFAHGRPYSRIQIGKLFNETLFTINAVEHCLYNFPSHSRMLIRTSDFSERVGAKLFPFLAGLLIVDAEKQVYSVKPIKGKAIRATKPIYVPEVQPA